MNPFFIFIWGQIKIPWGVMALILRWRVVYGVFNRSLHARQCAKAESIFNQISTYLSICRSISSVSCTVSKRWKSLFFFCFNFGFAFREQECSVHLSSFWYKYVFFCIALINIIMLLVQCSPKEADFANTQEMVSNHLLYCHNYVFLSITLLIPFLFNPLCLTRIRKTGIAIML